MDKSTRLSGYIYALHLDGGPIRYVGMTTRSLSVRFSQHKYVALKGEANFPLYKWMRKYPGLVRISLIEEVPTGHPDGLEAREIFHISKAREELGDTLLNMASGGKATRHSEKTKKKLAAIQLGRKHSEERRANNSAAQTGKKLSPEHRAKMAERSTGNTYNLGKKASDETRSKMSQSHKGKKYSLGHKQSEEHRAKVSAALKSGKAARGAHNRWHASRGILKPAECKFCAEEVRLAIS